MTTTSTTSTTPRTTYECRVRGVRPLSTDTFEVELRSPASLALGYRSGQYLQLELDVKGDGTKHSLSYSIANSFDPCAPRRLQIFIQNHNDFSHRVLARLRRLSKSNTPVIVKLPLGEAFLQTKLESPHLLVAAGSGISKIKCLAEEILKHAPDVEVSIYWSNRRAEEFYLLDQFQKWAQQHRRFRFTPVLEAKEGSWTGRTGFLCQVIARDTCDLSVTKAYLCGSPRMVYGTIDGLQAQGLQEGNCYSDVFEYAPREKRLPKSYPVTSSCQLAW